MSTKGMNTGAEGMNTGATNMDDKNVESNANKPARLDSLKDLDFQQTKIASEPELKDVFISSDSNAADRGKTHGYWQFSGASVRGLAHQQYGIPCQDRHGYRTLKGHNSGWALAVVADGAGSKSHSDIGARLVVEATLDYLQDRLNNRRYYAIEPSSVFMPPQPPSSQLETFAIALYEHLYSRLQDYARRHDMAIDALGCTLIATILTPQGVSLIHIGDGRAAFQDMTGQWQALMTPWRSEDGYTVFVTTQALRKAINQANTSAEAKAHTIQDYTKNTEPKQDYIRATIINQPVQAVVLMSDGVEHSAFEYQVFDETLQRYVRPNRPFANFLNPVKATLNKLHAHYVSDQMAINERFASFLQQGTETLKKEGDDKTLVFAVYKSICRV